jgi:6,7-dimethyl-8-ribityllumazine synthase
VVARFNEQVTKRLLAGALETLAQHGVPESAVDAVWVPGSFEIPLVAKQLAGSGKYVAVICLGAVIRGETSHHEYINAQTSAGIQQAALATGVPVLYGVLNCDTVEQALDRAGPKVGNKGAEAALAAIEMVNLLGQLPR